MRSIIALGVSLAMLTDAAMAQGQPVHNATPLQAWVLFIGTGMLGLAIMYGILKTRSRTVGEKRLRDEATKDVYRAEERRNP